MKIEMAKLDKCSCVFWKVFLSGFSDQEKINDFVIALIEFEALVVRNMIGSDFLSG